MNGVVCAFTASGSLGLPHPTQQRGAPGFPDRSFWTGGHETEPYEQNTQQSWGFGRSVVPQPVHA